MELDDRELKRLKELVPYKILSPTPDEICEEIERLNNIINELEKDIDLELYKTRANDEYNKGLFNAFRYVKDKLQELKGSGNNEQI